MVKGLDFRETTAYFTKVYRLIHLFGKISGKDRWDFAENEIFYVQRSLKHQLLLTAYGYIDQLLSTAKGYEGQLLKYA